MIIKLMVITLFILSIIITGVYILKTIFDKEE